jgi:hypothetical protein
MGRQKAPLLSRDASVLRPEFSTWSRFDDQEWRLAEPMAGQRSRHGALDWHIPLDEHESLLNEKHERLWWHLRVFVWTMVHDPRGSKSLSPGGLTQLRETIKTGVRWMASEGLSDFTRLDSAASWRYLNFYLSTHEQKKARAVGRTAKITWASASARLKFVVLVHRQRKALEKFGVMVPAESPYDGLKVDRLVQGDLDLQRPAKLDPIPDEVALLLMNTAQAWLGVRADDIARLERTAGSLVKDEQDPKTRSEENKLYAQSNHALKEFTFSTLDGEDEPWMVLEGQYQRTLRDGRTGLITGRQILRRLLTDVQAAAVVCIQSMSGVRASELASLEDDGSSGSLPSCVTMRRSPDGLLDLFYCRGVEHKVTKERVEWLIGSRLAGTEYLPPPVRAFSVVHTLLAKWRALGGHGKLFLTFSSAKGLPKAPTSVGRVTSTYLTNLQKDFFLERCDLAGLGRQAVERFVDNHELRGQKWRTTFATFLYRIDARLLEPVSRHFKHLRVAMTEARYIGNDVQLLETLDASRVQESARFFYEAIEDHVPVVGRLAKELSTFPLEKGSTLPAYELAVVDHDLRLLAFEYGVCGVALKPEESLCNEQAGTNRWFKRSPNEAFRGVSTCLGCRCFAASTQHLPFWIRRLRLLAAAYRNDRKLGSHASYVIKKRLSMARAMVWALSKAKANKRV